MQTFTPLEYLKIDVASSFGLDKENWDDRIAWFDQNENVLETLVDRADEPAHFYAGTHAYRDTVSGKPIGYPISLDSTASGIQILSCLSGCEDTARLCNLISTGQREDAYTRLYGYMCEEQAETASIGRTDTKNAIMTAFYNSEREPQKVFGTGSQLDTFYRVLETRTPGAWQLKTMMEQMWQPYATEHVWVLPDNFHSINKVESLDTHSVMIQGSPKNVSLSVNRGTKKGKALGPNLTHSIDGMVVREMLRRCSFSPTAISRVLRLIKFGASGTRTRTYDDSMVERLWELYQASGFLSARILDHLQPENFGFVDPEAIRTLVLSMPVNPFRVITIHDCFRCLATYANDLRQQYNNILAEVAASNMFSFLASQILGQEVAIEKLSNFADQIRHADYALS
jgi:hypothetical protein